MRASRSRFAPPAACSVIAALVLAALALQACRGADVTPEQIAAWVDQLKAPEWQVREEAA